jgi:hypothetical protein
MERGKCREQLGSDARQAGMRSRRSTVPCDSEAALGTEHRGQRDLSPVIDLMRSPRTRSRVRIRSRSRRRAGTRTCPRPSHTSSWPASCSGLRPRPRRVACSVNLLQNLLPDRAHLSRPQMRWHRSTAPKPPAATRPRRTSSSRRTGRSATRPSFGRSSPTDHEFDRIAAPLDGTGARALADHLPDAVRAGPAHPAD